MNALQEAAQRFRIFLHGPPLESPSPEEEYRRVFAAMAQKHVDGLLISDQGENVTNRRLILELAYNTRLPTVFPFAENYGIGALLAYGPPLADLFRRLAGYVDQILKGARPGELPIY